MRVLTAIALSASVAGMYVYRRASEIARREGRPLSTVLGEMPRRFAEDLRTLDGDVRAAVDEGREAARREAEGFDVDLEQAGITDDPGSPA